ncbi:hypothetical protein AB1Y20_021800 [Prymnesium parvum]|uniref:Zinc transporter n=1 Tax=Prymnesium parvum TaxID=97485 RepID=A0AB34JL92_PRYPA
MPQPTIAPALQHKLWLPDSTTDESHLSLILKDDAPLKGNPHGRRLFWARPPQLPWRALAAGGLALLLCLYFASLGLRAMLEHGLSHKHAAMAMSLGAGMATGIGACFVLCTSTFNRQLLAGTMAFSSGVMVYVSLVEVVGVANEYFEASYSKPVAYAWATASFFGGVVLMALVDRAVHAVFDAVTARARASAETELRHGSRPVSDDDEQCDSHRHEHADEEASSIIAVAAITEKRRLLMMSAVVSAAIALHNIPEGMATYVASFHSVAAGLPLAIAIAIHNIPEGLAIAMPVFYATHSRARAIGLGALSGFSEPFGALLASFVANESSSSASFGCMFGLTAGMMTYVCISELLPAAYGEVGVSKATVTCSFFLGCAVMALSIVLEKFASA